MAKRANTTVNEENTSENTVATQENAQDEVFEDESATPLAKVYTEKELNQEVEVFLFKDDDKYKDDVFVAVNGKNILIPRGKPVKVKRKFALALEESQKQDNITSQNIAALLAKDI